MKNSAATLPAVLTFTSLASTPQAPKPAQSTVRTVRNVKAVGGTANVWTIVETAYVEACAVQSGVDPSELAMVSLRRTDRVPSF